MGMSENRAQRAVLERLFALQDTKYRAFQSKLMPTVAPETVIGVRTPLLRNLAKELAGTAEAADFLRVLPHAYYEENNLHAFLVEKIRDYDAALAETERFLPYIDNWATCDITACGMKTLGRAPATAFRPRFSRSIRTSC